MSRKGSIRKGNQKKGEEFHIFITTEFILEKKPQTGTGVVKIIAGLLGDIIRV